MEALLIAALSSCPLDLSQQIDGLYRWQIERQNSHSPRNLSSQRQRFTPELYQQLQQGFALTPMRDGRFVDFDVFSGTQVTTFGATVSGCSWLKAGSVNAQVAVDTGLGGRSSGRPQQLEYRMVQRDGRWRIADIHYPGEPGFSLSSFLNSLLKGR
mgnify:FL=1|tara:strand:+ start:750 stop:1217 length:468 start_codon:yes stop_codon:yes gene_type:complete